MTTRHVCPKCGNEWTESVEAAPAPEASAETTAKVYFEWKPEYNIGIPEVDEQHQRLGQVLNNMFKAVKTTQRDPNFVKGLLKELEHYITEHFAFEEKMMASAMYPQLANHIRMHKSFSSKVSEMKREFEESFFTLRPVLQFLTGWFVEHIQGEDRAFAKFLNK